MNPRMHQNRFLENCNRQEVYMLSLLLLLLLLFCELLDNGHIGAIAAIHPRTTEYGYKSYRLQNGGTGAVDSK